MRLLVTGAAGFLGRNALLAAPHSWHVVALYRPGNREFLNFLEHHGLEHVQAVACDLTNDEQVRQAAARYSNTFDCCLALASNTSIPFSLEQPVQDLVTNTVGLLNVLNAYTCEHLVYLSSGAVYIGREGLVGPASPISPTLPYAISKLAAEQYIRAYAHHRQAFQYATLVRFFGAYGPYEPPRKLYTKLVRQFAFERDPYFTVTGDGKNYIDAMYVDDAIAALLAIINTSPQERVSCIDLGIGRGESVNQVVTRAAHTFGLEPQLHHTGTSPEYIQFFIDPHPFAQRYGFAPSISLEEGLRRLATHLASTKDHNVRV